MPTLGVVGIDASGDIYGGYDQTYPLAKKGLTAVERKRLAEIMIARWKAFGDLA